MVRSRKKRNQKIILNTFIGLILIVGIVALFQGGILQTQFGGNVFVKPDWARLECSPTDAYEGTFIRWIDQTTFFPCNAFTEECRYSVENTASNILFVAQGSYLKCDIDGNNCGRGNPYSLRAEEKITLPTLKSGESYRFKEGFLILGEDITKVTEEWKPWKLFRFVGGAKFEVNNKNCDLTSSTRERIVSEDFPTASKLFRQGGEGTKWLNYVNDWNFGPATNIFSHSTYGEVYCSSGKIFDIVELKMSDGKLRKVNPEYSQTLPDGQRLNGLGNQLSSVECCPNEPRCGENFEFIPEPKESECFSDLQCDNAGGPVPITGTSFVQTTCVNEKCVKSEPINVECTTSAQCSQGEICDLSTLNYGVCIEQVAGDFCGDGICDLTESSKTCVADCGTGKIDGKEACDEKALAQPFLGWTWVEESEEVGQGPLGIGRIVGLTKTVTTGECKATFVPYYILGGIVLILGGIIIFQVNRRIPKRGKK